MLTGSSGETGIIHLTLQAVTAYVTSRKAEELAPENGGTGHWHTTWLLPTRLYAKTMKISRLKSN